MALHEQSVGASDEWYTPGYVFDAMCCQFSLDPCAPEQGRAFCAALRWSDKQYTRADNGLIQPWHGCVWMNAPFGGRNGLEPWLDKFTDHGNGIALVPDRTSAPWWQTYARKMDCVLFVGKKIKFIAQDGTPGNSPAQGTCLFGLGKFAREVLMNAEKYGLGFVMEPVT